MELLRSVFILVVILTAAYAVGMGDPHTEMNFKAGSTIRQLRSEPFSLPQCSTDDLFTIKSTNDREMCDRVTVCRWFKDEEICKCIPIKRSRARRSWCISDDQEKCEATISSNKFSVFGKCEWLEDAKCCSCPPIFIGK